ncbi:hypothetical protein BDF19DRAFT_432670 [Syncephalis fuscata]|nr:hypothetical protein BDF19DRAFT_432670 [Syncephalis fuscata]
MVCYFYTKSVQNYFKFPKKVSRHTVFSASLPMCQVTVAIFIMTMTKKLALFLQYIVLLVALIFTELDIVLQIVRKLCFAIFFDHGAQRRLIGQGRLYGGGGGGGYFANYLHMAHN